jgi:hypothetical protein
MWCSVSWGVYLPLYIGKGKNGSKVNEKLKLSVNGHELSSVYRLGQGVDLGVKAWFGGLACSELVESYSCN